MSRVIHGNDGKRMVVIEKESPRTCEFCGEVKELRPYGPNGESVCFECAMLDEKAAERQMRKHLYGETDN